ncbi:hypothetical protein EB118_01415 [bacterium]|nr:hypothetical protein [bacterium]NBX98565.1 hypothetical protein [bacterium]NDC93802.1 hypothetical protein [bacterium]NDD83592.1 hypothetical protein [bacterium]NDG28748.1 hypothetical protein [bacterium]
MFVTRAEYKQKTIKKDTMKKNQDGIVHHLALLLVGVVVLSAIGFAGYRVYNNKNSVKAKAAGYPLVGEYKGKNTNVRVKACRPSAYDIKDNKRYYQVKFLSESNGAVIFDFANKSLLPLNAFKTTVYTRSMTLNDKVTLQPHAGGNNGYYTFIPTTLYVSTLPTC